MSIQITERTVTSGSTMVKIRTAENDIRIIWPCRTGHTFSARISRFTTAALLQEAIAAIDASAVAHEGVWVSLKAATGYPFAVKVVSGQLYASETADIVGDASAYSVNWVELKKALNRAVRSL
jgi:hypothetical protein